MGLLKKKIGFTAAAILLLFLAACGGGGGRGGGGGGGGGGRLPVTNINISPETANVKAGESVTLTVTVSPRNTEFTVSAAAGNFTTDGSKVVYTPPAVAGTYELTVTAGTRGKATAQIAVKDIADIEIPEGSISNGVNGVNDSGRIVVEVIDPQGRRKAFLTDRNGGNPVPVAPDGGGDVYVFGINNSNNVLGRSDNGYFLMRTRSGRVEYITLELEGYPSADFTAINNAGHQAGYYTESDGYVSSFIKEGDGSVWMGIRHPDVNYTGCGNINIQPCGTYITGINNAGHAVGYYVNASGVQYGFMLAGSAFKAINHPDTRPNNPINLHVSGINDNGKVVGYFWGADLYSRGFISDGSKFTVFDHPGAMKAVEGGYGTYITGVNNSSQITGWFDDGYKRGFLVTNP